MTKGAQLRLTSETSPCPTQRRDVVSTSRTWTRERGAVHASWIGLVHLVLASQLPLLHEAHTFAARPGAANDKSPPPQSWILLRSRSALSRKDAELRGCMLLGHASREWSAVEGWERRNTDVCEPPSRPRPIKTWRKDQRANGTRPKTTSKWDRSTPEHTRPHQSHLACTGTRGDGALRLQARRVANSVKSGPSDLRCSSRLQAKIIARSGLLPSSSWSPVGLCAWPRAVRRALVLLAGAATRRTAQAGASEPPTKDRKARESSIKLARGPGRRFLSVPTRPARGFVHAAAAGEPPRPREQALSDKDPTRKSSEKGEILSGVQNLF